MRKVLVEKTLLFLNMLFSAFLATVICSIFIFAIDHRLHWFGAAVFFGFCLYALPNCVLWLIVFLLFERIMNGRRKAVFLSAVMAGVIYCLGMSVWRQSHLWEIYTLIGPASVVSALIACLFSGYRVVPRNK